MELATPTLTPAQLHTIEDQCNEAVRAHVAMTPRWIQPGAAELEKVFNHWYHLMYNIMITVGILCNVVHTKIHVDWVYIVP